MGTSCSGSLSLESGHLSGERREKSCSFSQVAWGYFASTECEVHCLCLALLVGGRQRFLGNLTGHANTQGSEDVNVLS